MSQKYADIIIDISYDALDRPFQYKIPEFLEDDIDIGVQVSIPFGRGDHVRSGYVISITEVPAFDVDRIKSILEVKPGGIPIEGSLIALASYIKEQYGSTMINALRTVMPVKKTVKRLTHKEVCLAVTSEEAGQYMELYRKKNARAKRRLLTELMEESVIPYSLVTGELNISSATLKSMQAEHVIRVEEEGYYRNVLKNVSDREGRDILHKQEIPNTEQQTAIDRVLKDYENGKPDTYLLKGVTGSGKTLVYIEIIDKLVAMGKQAIVLIPEIALTYQTVKRFRRRFGDKVTIINSRLSKGERYDQFEKARNEEVSVIIGPRSALFAPFPNLGIIVIDEEHETTYKSEYPPKYHAREVAIHRAKMAGASVLLGSATPSVEAYYRATKGIYQLLTLNHRASEGAKLAETSVVDLREELKRGNRSIFSDRLKERIRDRLKKGEQTILFINRRGFSGFVSCRSCGHVIKCPHCDVSLTEHFPGTAKEKLSCHYCGYEQKKPKTCPECQSPYIAGFGIGTQKVEEQVRLQFPEARVIRMDSDTTKKKEDHEKLLSQFANEKADILVGTQMVVKGHDFSNVTLVGIISADLTLFDNDYRSAERTFDLLTQAAGRAGRGQLKGEVIIQTYAPEHYCIETAAKQDYQAFYEAEKSYRNLLSYPPFCHVLAVFMEGDKYEELVELSQNVKQMLEGWGRGDKVRIIGPCDATITKINDRYRRIVYLKHKEYNALVRLKDQLEDYMEDRPEFKDSHITFDFDPMYSY